MKSLRIILLNGPKTAGTYEAADQYAALVPDACVLPMYQEYDTWLKDAAQRIDRCLYIVVPDAGWWTAYMIAERLVDKRHICMVMVERTGAEFASLEGRYAIEAPEVFQYKYRIVNNGDATRLGKRLHEIIAHWECDKPYFMELNT